MSTSNESASSSSAAIQIRAISGWYARSRGRRSSRGGVEVVVRVQAKRRARTQPVPADSERLAGRADDGVLRERGRSDVRTREASRAQGGPIGCH